MPICLSGAIHSEDFRKAGSSGAGTGAGGRRGRGGRAGVETGSGRGGARLHFKSQWPEVRQDWPEVEGAGVDVGRLRFTSVLFPRKFAFGAEAWQGREERSPVGGTRDGLRHMRGLEAGQSQVLPRLLRRWWL